MDTDRHFSSVLVGEGALALSCADILVNRGHAIRAMVSADPLLRRYAAEKGIIHVAPSDNWGERLAALSFDVLFSIGYLRVVPESVLRLPRRAAINFHDSLLPRHAGLHATSWALLEQAREHGVTWHLMTGRVDAGSILKQQRVPVTERETAFSLNKKCLEAGIVSFESLVTDLAAGALRPTPQDLAARTEHGRFARPSCGGIIDWARPAEALDALVRALDFGNQPNPLGAPKISLAGEWFIIPDLRVLPSASEFPPGTIVSIRSDAVAVATGTRDVQFDRALTLEGQSMLASEMVARLNLCEGRAFDRFGPEQWARLATLIEKTCRREPQWVAALQELRPLELVDLIQTGASNSTECASVRIALPGDLVRSVAEAAGGPANETIVAALACFFATIRDDYAFDIGFGADSPQRELAGLERLFATHVPLRIELDPRQNFQEAVAGVRTRLDSLRQLNTFTRDLAVRYPALHPDRMTRGLSLPIAVEFSPEDQEHPGTDADLTIRISDAANACTWAYQPARLSRKAVTNLARHFATFLRHLLADPNRKIGEVSLLTEAQRHELICNWNNTGISIPKHHCQHELFERQTEQSPDRVAVVYRDQELSYRELNARANQLAHALRAKGVGPGKLVGISMSRSLEMIVALLGTLKAGGAYVPLDPEYPKERLAFILEDARIGLVIAQPELAGALPVCGAEVFPLDSTWKAIEQESRETASSEVKPSDLAYVIYTSGSTGKPKGVMVEHRNVVNFFTGMDRTIGGGGPGTWLAVTSISFDISVLELFWTLTRGFKVIVQPEQGAAAAQRVKTRSRSGGRDRKMDFSLFYFASDEGNSGQEKYRLLLEGAKFADRNGFAAVWTPERHFHAFGGLYPNPSVTSAAVAAVTEQIQIRAGSVVLPLHNPIRVAEEWAVVDNLSKGRVGISFASGWHANDFVLAPDHYRESKAVMLREIETVRKLWRGEAISFRNGKGETVPIRILPHPVQQELPIWITAAGNPETFRLAGELGAGLLTHLLGQTVESLADKIAVYREAWRKHGHPGSGHVTLMLHTYVGESIDAVRDAVRAPFSDYLRSSVDLIKNAPSAFPTLAKAPKDSTLDRAMQSGDFKQADMDALVAHAFDRYFETSALFGTPDSCLATVDRLKDIGVNEVACLIDFGVETDQVMSGLQLLKQVKERSNEARAARDEDDSIPAQIFRHEVTHFQCTPSMARMLLAQERGPEALGRVQKLFLGGEPLPPSLLEQLKPAIQGELFNMYGPTETTIWSTVGRIDPESGRIHIGRPIANTEIYILNRHLQPVPIGVSGELFIGGAGVARGYLNRPELTAERFIRNPFKNDPDARLYRTGDLARYLPDGTIEFLGRVDNQVKIRGHRIEIREIEVVLEQHPAIREAAVTAESDAADNKRLIGYLVAQSKENQPSIDEVRRYLESKLPEYMIPQAFAWLDAMPLTPNGKVDRRALPRVTGATAASAENFAPPSTPIEKQLADIWAQELSLARVGIHDNFFNLGGNSLLAVQIAFKVRQALGVQLPLNRFFEFPTVAGLARKLEETLVEQAESSKLEALLAEIENLPEGEETKSGEALASPNR